MLTSCLSKSPNSTFCATTRPPCSKRMAFGALLPTTVHQNLCWREGGQQVYKGAAHELSKPKLVGPPPLPLLTIHFVKRSIRSRLGMSFFPEAVDGGVLVTKLEFGSVAWRSKLRAGDVVMSVIYDGEDHPLQGGFQAAQLLRQTDGLLRFCVRRRKLSIQDVAARRIQAVARGMFARSREYVTHLAASHIQACWRRAEAMMDLADAFWAVDVIHAVTRKHLARCFRARAARTCGQIRLPAYLEREPDDEG